MFTHLVDQLKMLKDACREQGLPIEPVDMSALLLVYTTEESNEALNLQLQDLTSALQDIDRQLGKLSLLEQRLEQIVNVLITLGQVMEKGFMNVNCE